jgi:hypothetical protein
MLLGIIYIASKTVNGYAFSNNEAFIFKKKIDYIIFNNTTHN